MIGTKIISRLNNNILIGYNNSNSTNAPSTDEHEYIIAGDGAYKALLMDMGSGTGVYYTHGLAYLPSIMKPTAKAIERLIRVRSTVRTMAITLYFKAGYVPEVDYVLRVMGETTTGDTSAVAMILVNYDLILKHQRMLSNPMTYGSQVFDRYITFQVPAVANLNDTNGFELNGYLHIKPQSPLIADLSPISGIARESYDLGTYYDVKDAGDFKVTIPSASQADRFNVYLSLDKKNGHIVYYPYWGSDMYNALDASTMNAIESRGINLYYGTDGMANVGWDDFGSHYGKGERKWVTIHELKVIKSYTSLSRKQDVSTYSFTEYYTEFNRDGVNPFKYSFRPTVFDEEVVRDPSKDVKGLDVVYTCRLVNRQDMTQVVRTASLSLSGSELDRYRHLSSRPLNLHIDKLNLVYENGKGEGVAQLENSHTKETKTVLEKVFYDTKDIKVNVHGEGIYTTQGSTLLKLHKSPSLYVFRLYDEKRKERLDLTTLNGLVYLRVFDEKGQPIDIEPTYSKNMNPVLGELEFYINEQLTALLKLSSRTAEEKTYAIISKTQTITTTIVDGLYE